MDDSPTEEELNLITAINVIREAIGIKYREHKNRRAQ